MWAYDRAPWLNERTFQHVRIVKSITLLWLIIPARTGMRTRYVICFIFLEFVIIILGQLLCLCDPHNGFLLTRYFVLNNITLVQAFLSMSFGGKLHKLVIPVLLNVM